MDLLNENLAQMLELKNSTNEKTELYLYGNIVSKWYNKWDDTDKYPMEIKNFLTNAAGRDIDVHINSDGGAVAAGMAIYNTLKTYPGKITVYIDGIAASIASVIALAGDEIIMRPGSMLMIHKPMFCVCDMLNADDCRKLAEDLDEIGKAVMQIYEENKLPDVDIKEIERMLTEATWLPSDEAAKFFNITTEEDGLEAVAYSGDLIGQFLGGIPPQFAQVGKNQEKVNETDEEAKARAVAELELLKMEVKNDIR